MSNFKLELILFMHLIYSLQGSIQVFNKKNVSIGLYDDLIARFGPRLPLDGLKGWINVAKPLDGCSQIEKPPNISGLTNWIALIQRSAANSNCSFDLKVSNAQQAGYSSAIIFNINSNYLVKMSSSGEHEVYVPSVFIGESDGLEIIQNFTYVHGYHVMLIEDEYNISIYLIPFCVVVGTCFLIMLSVFAIKFIIYYRKTRKNRLSRSALKKIPTRKYQKTDKYDTCPICLDEYEEGVKIRILPCDHVYHIKCIDEWLLKNNRFCPVCKRRVLPGDEESAGEDGEESSQQQQEQQQPLAIENGTRVLINSTINGHAADDENNHQSSATDETSRLINNNNSSTFQPTLESPQHRSLNSSPTRYGSILNSNSIDLGMSTQAQSPRFHKKQTQTTEATVATNDFSQSTLNSDDDKLHGESFRSCINDEQEEDELIESVDNDDRERLLPHASSKSKKR